MKKALKVMTLAAMFVAMPFFASAQMPIRHPYCITFTGTATINGVPAPIDSSITLEVAGREIVDSFHLSDEGKYFTGVTKSQVVAGEVIDFKINGIDAGEYTVVEREGSYKEVYNLAASGQVKGDTDTAVIDGDIIQCKSSANPNAVYIVKIVNGKKYIRHIVSLQIFNSYKHLKWTDLIQVQSLDGFALSGWARVNTGANGAPGQQDKVFEINDDQTKHWIDMTAAEFLLHGGKDEAIFNVNPSEMALYKTGAAVKLQ